MKSSHARPTDSLKASLLAIARGDRFICILMVAFWPELGDTERLGRLPHGAIFVQGKTKRRADVTIMHSIFRWPGRPGLGGGGGVQKWRNADTGSWALKDHEIRWTEEGGLASLLE